VPNSISNSMLNVNYLEPQSSYRFVVISSYYSAIVDYNQVSVINDNHKLKVDTEKSAINKIVTMLII